MRKDAQRGQVLLIVVLIMVVGFTVGLSVASKTIVNIRTTTEEENSQKAFSAAEAGVEQALLKSGQEGVVGGSGIEFGTNVAKIKEVNVINIEGREFVMNGHNPIRKDDGAEIWLADHNNNGKINPASSWSGNLTLFWGKLPPQADCSNAGLVITVFSGSVAAPVTTRYTVDPCQSRRNDNKFSSPDGAGQLITFAGKTTNFAYAKTLTISNGILARVVPIYSDTQIGVKTVSSDPILPSQGKQIDSTGQSADTFRKVSYFQGYPKCPSEFCQYVLLVPK